MSYFAKLDKNNIVIDIIKAEQSFINTGLVGDSFLWVQTSYNNNFRNKFACIGFTYDKANDVFIEPQPYPSWTLDETFNWKPPVEKPVDMYHQYIWNENNLTWDIDNTYAWDTSNNQWMINDQS